MKKLLILISITALIGCSPKIKTQQECETAGGLMQWETFGDCYTDKESEDYKWALKRKQDNEKWKEDEMKAKQKSEFGCIYPLTDWTYITDINSNDAIVMDSQYETWIIEKIGRGYAHGRSYSADDSYCYVATGYINTRFNYPIAKKIKWKK